MLKKVFTILLGFFALNSYAQTYKDPKAKTLEAIWEILRNAFIQALMPSVDNEINISSVSSKKSENKKNILQKIFTPDKKKEGQKK